MTILQIVTFTASSNYIADPTVVKVALDNLGSAEGCVSSFHGLQIDDGKTVYVFSFWESEPQYQSFAGGPENPTFLAGLKAASANSPEVHYLDTGAIDLTAAFSAPVTEFVLWTINADVEPQEAELVKGFDDLIAGLDVATGVHPPGLWAYCKDNTKNVVVIAGWNTVDTHWEAVKEGTGLHATVQLLLKKATLVLGHVKLLKQ
ncbi:hypothetical protein FB45DRAFT_923071 [Roridomyces roridus]|uniref:ABM domain-containing protein n=1 Tax=Roridomyces roridus TaxID=1738132 RepID=A0AAD7BNQ6_9AGAR|nr:hypothetical protein FB45DRAFT_923071 [Roridomyces roridus]